MKRVLNVRNVFSIATGAMIGSGFFLLPGIAYAKAGPAVVLAYFLAAVLVVPTLLSTTELATAMPRSGGTYFFVSRSMGPMAGVLDGLGAWVAMVAKSSFALVGIGYYVAIVVGNEDPVVLVRVLGVVTALGLAAVNIYGTKESGFFQTLLVAGLVIISAYFVGRGAFSVETARLTPFAPKGFAAILATSALVFVSYAGLTKVTSVSEEVVNPEKTIPLGMFVALGVTTLIYVLGVLVVVGVMPGDELARNRAPLAAAAEAFAGTPSMIAMVVAGVFAFVTTGNAGILSASRYLFAMARDRVLPASFGRLSSRETPAMGVAVSTGAVIAVICLFDAQGIAKLASTFLLVEFAAVNLSVIVMRESQVGSYDPGFRAPAYPWVPLAGILASAVLIPLMGFMALAFAISLFVVGLAWYALYAHGRAEHATAMRLVLERIATEILSREAAGPALDRELREIMMEKGLREADPFVDLLRRAEVIDLPDGDHWDDLMLKAVEEFSAVYPGSASEIRAGLYGTGELGETPAGGGVALPHMRLEEALRYELVMARSVAGLHFPGVKAPVYAVFVLLGTTEDPQQHLRILAEIAGRAGEPDFLRRWKAAADAEALRSMLIRTRRET